MKDSRGQPAGYKVTYSLIDKENKEDGKELQQGQEPKTENKDDKKKDESVTADTDKSKETAKEDASAGNNAASNTTTGTDKNKETSTATTGTDKNKETTTTTGTDKNKETPTATAGTDKNKETPTTTAGTDKNKETTTTTGTDKNKETPTATTGTDKNKETPTTTAGADKNKETSTATTGADKNKETSTTTGTDKNNKDKNEPVAANTDPLDMYEHIKTGNEIIFPVKSLDKNLPFLPIPANLPVGKYTLVFQVKGKNTILYKFEKPLFYLADAEFSFEGIQVHLPGIAESLQFIQNKNVILLDVHLDFDSRLEPYVVWYNGKKIIDEGRYSDGAGTLFWKAPEQNGFVSIRAEVFPSWDKSGLTGYQKGISLLVSSKEVDMHLLSGDTTNLLQWYVFEDDLNDSLTKDKDFGELLIEPAGKNKPNWIASNGTYGLAAGTDNAFKLPAVSIKNKEDENANWQIVSRFKPLGEGEIYSVQFGSADITAALSIKKSNLILSLTSASNTVSEALKLPNEDDSFTAVSVKFIIQNGLLSAKLAFVKPNENFNNQKEPVINPISITAEVDKDVKIVLGNLQKKPADNAQTAEDKEPEVKESPGKEPLVKEPSAKESSVKEPPVKELSVPGQPFTALWDELAILRLPEVKIINIKKNTKEAKVEATAAAETELPEAGAANIPDDESTLPE